MVHLSPMNKSLSLALCFAGFVLFVYGVSASDSIGTDLSRFFTGSPTEKTMWILIGGFAAGMIGASGLIRSSPSL